MTTTTAPPNGVLEKRSGKPKIPYKEQIRGFRMRDDDRELILDRRQIAFAIPLKEEPAGATVIGLKASKPIVVATPYSDIVEWWLGKDAPPTPPARANANPAA
jgi:hypothetical protein